MTIQAKFVCELSVLSTKYNKYISPEEIDLISKISDQTRGNFETTNRQIVSLSVTTMRIGIREPQDRRLKYPFKTTRRTRIK